MIDQHVCRFNVVLDRWVYDGCTNLLLEREDVGDATVDGVAEAGLDLVEDGDDGVEVLVRGDLEEELGHVAAPNTLCTAAKCAAPCSESK